MWGRSELWGSGFDLPRFIPGGGRLVAAPRSSRHFRVSPKFWAEAKRESWRDDEIILGLYILTCDHRLTEGLFRLPMPYVCSDLRWSSERLSSPFASLIERNFVSYDEAAEVVLITKALKWQAPATDKQMLGAWRQIEELPSTPLLTVFIELADTYAKGFANWIRMRLESDSNPQALALAPSLAPSPSSTHSNGDGDGSAFSVFKTVENALEEAGDLDDVDRDLAIKVMWPRLKAGEHFTSPVAYALKVASNARDERLRASPTHERKLLQVADEVFEHIDGEWQRVEVPV